MEIQLVHKRYILVGDLHVTKTNLEESARLLQWVRGLCAEYQAGVIFLGDQYHDHGLARVEIKDFWHDHFSQFEKAVARPLALVGNHDMNHEGTHHWMSVHSEYVDVVDRPLCIPWSHAPGLMVGCLPFIKQNAEFLAAVYQLYNQGCRIFLCHQEFNGCQYDNGFYAPHGVLPADLPSDAGFVSGHIHTQQRVVRSPNGYDILYIGAPRQFTRADIGKSKFVVLWQPSGATGSQAASSEFTNIPVPESVCQPFRHIVVSPDQPLEGGLDVSERVYVDIYGSAEFIRSTTKQLPTGVKHRTFPTDRATQSVVRESDGVSTALLNYVLDYANQNSLDNTVTQSLLQRIYTQCPELKGK